MRFSSGESRLCKPCRTPKVEPPPKPTRKPKKKAAKVGGGPNLFDQEDGETPSVEIPKWTLDDAPFETPISECGRLLRDGRFYGAVALANAIVESAVLFIWRVKVRKRKNQTADFVKALVALHDNSLIGLESKAAIERMWEDRHMILLPTSRSDKQQLEESAKTGLSLTKELVQDYFGYAQREGVIIPNHPEYWQAAREEAPVVAGRGGNS